MGEWTTDDHNNAVTQGWDIFLSIDSDNGLYQLQRIDEPEQGAPVFDGDTQAWEFVYKRFLIGDRLAKKALYFLSQNCMEEFQRIKKHCEDTITKDSLYNPV